MKLDISGRNRITLQGCRLYWSSSFLLVQVRQNWQYWHSCVVESLGKTLLIHEKNIDLISNLDNTQVQVPC